MSTTQGLTIVDLRQRLFETIDAVKHGTLEVERARVVGQLAQVIVHSARVEVDFHKSNGSGTSAFLEPPPEPEPLPPGITGVRRHRLLGG
jgi:hypothetical protein